MDAITLLTKHHRELRRLLRLLEGDGARTVALRGRAFVELAHLLVIHAGVEEDVLYPELEGHAATGDEARHAYEEHHLIDVQLDELAMLGCAAPRWGDKLHVLREVLDHHLEEEERDLFPLIPKVLGAQRYRAVSEAMYDRCESLTRQMEGELATHSAQSIAIRRRVGN